MQTTLSVAACAADIWGMGAHPSDPAIAAHIESVSARAELDTVRLAAAIVRCCWPGGTSDRIESGALAWVRRWGPRASGATPPVCNCPDGRCRVCN